MLAVTHMCKEVYAYRELLFAMTYRDIRVKYKQAVMGVAWVFFMPMLAIISGIMFRFAMALFSGRTLHVADVVSVMVKSLPWLLFASIVGGASNSLVGSRNLITKIYFPREIIPLSNLLSSLFDFLISITGLILLLTLLWFFGSDASPPLVVSAWLLLVPVLILILIVFAIGLGLFLAAANLFLRDVKYIVQVLLQFGIFFSCVYFKVEELGRWGPYLLLNPIVPLLEAMRMAVVSGGIDPAYWPWVAYSTIVAVLVLWFATLVFERAEYLFAEYA